MIAITKDTYPVALAHNPMAVQVTMTDIYEEYYSAGGSLAEFNFGITPASFVAGNIWSLYSPIMGLISFIISTTPDLADASQLFDSTIGTGFASYEEYVFDKLSRHPLLNKYYLVESYIDGSSVQRYKITGRKHHADYFLQNSYTGTTVSILNIGFPNPLLSQTDIIRKNINIKMRLWVEDSMDSPTFHEVGVYQGIGIDQHDANMMVVEFHEIPGQMLHQLDAELPRDAFNAFKCGNICKRYYYEVWAEWIAPDQTAQYTSMIKSDIKHMVLGGIDKEHVDWYAHWVNYYRNIDNNPDWLTFQRTGMEVNVNQYQWLTIFIDDVIRNNGLITPSANHAIVAECFYSGVFSVSVTIPTPVIDGFITGMYYIPIGYQQLGLGAYESAGTFDSYNIFLREISGPILSNTIKIKVDKENHKYGAVIGYHTSLGAFETFMNHIKDETNIKTTTNTNTTIMLEDNRVSTGTIGTVYISDQKHMKLRTGWICGGFKNIVNDFILSKYKYLIPRSIADSDQLPNYKRILNMSDEMLIKNDEFKYEMEWELAEAWTDSVFSDMEVIDEANYTDYLEFTIVNPSENNINCKIINGATGASRIFINGIINEFVAGTNTYIIKKNSIYNFKIEAKNLVDIAFSLTNNDMTLIFKNIDPPNLQSINIDQFANVEFNNIRQLLNLKNINTILVYSINNAYQLDQMLQVIADLQRIYGNLTSGYIDLTGSSPTPSPVGINAKDWLIAEGVSVSTN